MCAQTAAPENPVSGAAHRGEPAGPLDHRSSRSAFRSDSGFPRHLEASAVPATQLRATPAAASSGCADGERTGRPVFSFPRLRRPAGERVAPVSSPSGVSAAASPGYPGSCGSGWVDDDSPARLELCILSRAADESSHRSGLGTSLPDAGWLLHRAGVTSLPDEPAAKCPIGMDSPSSCQAGTACPVAYRVTNWKGA